MIERQSDYLNDYQRKIEDYQTEIRSLRKGNSLNDSSSAAFRQQSQDCVAQAKMIEELILENSRLKREAVVGLGSANKRSSQRFMNPSSQDDRSLLKLITALVNDLC